MALSVYVHIPYCLQRCRYCDFTTFELSELIAPEKNIPPEKYIACLRQEILHRHDRWADRELRTIYFGGGTPSLLQSDLIISILEELANVGFRWNPSTEITIEINPATIDEQKLDAYLRAGINRFSVGAQTFSDRLLQACNRKHSAADTRYTLQLLRSYQLNYSFDLLFALPNQSLSELQQDLDEVREFSPPHLSAYCLTVPTSHPMSLGRPPEDEQIEMFRLIEAELEKIALHKYEISNFARAGFESRHNLVYWNDQNYWGLGVSAHSYDPTSGPFGERFWNNKDLRTYLGQCEGKNVPVDQRELLQKHEALTDFNHMFLRTRIGLSPAAVRNKFGEASADRVQGLLRTLEQEGFLDQVGDRFRLTAKGEILSNQVFEKLTFLAH